MNALRCLLLCLLVGRAAAASFECVPFNKSLLPEPCATYDPSSWAYIDTETETLQDLIDFTTASISTTIELDAVPYECELWQTTFFCQNPGLLNHENPLRCCPVDANDQPPTTPTVIPICRSMCEGFYAACQPAYVAVGPAFADLLPKDFCDAYSNDGVTVDGVHYGCWNVTPTFTPAIPNRTCPTYTSKNLDGRCWPRCPSPEYTSDQVFRLGLMQQIVSWISFVSAFVLAAFFAFKKELRGFPSRIILFLLISSMILSLAYMLATFVGGNVGDVWCGQVESFSLFKLNAEDRTINNEGLCAFQGWNIILGTLCLGFWWACLSLNTALIVHAGLEYSMFESKRLLEAGYHGVCWGVPLILSIVAAAASKINYEPSYAFCFISSSDGRAWQIGLWFVPIGLCLLVGLVCSLYSVVVLNARQTKMNSTFRVATIRILCCVLFFFTIIAIIFAYVIYAAAQEDGNAMATVNYLFCLLINVPESECRTILNHEQPLGTQYDLANAATFFMAAAGVFLALFFGTSEKVVTAVRSSSTGEMAVSSFSRNREDTT